MSPEETSQLEKLEDRLFGEDGSGTGGALGQIASRLTKLEERFNRIVGALALGAFLAGIAAPKLIELVMANVKVGP